MSRPNNVVLRPRDVAVLEALADHQGHMGISPGNLFYRAFPDAPRRGRSDAGMTRTLDRLQSVGLVKGMYEWQSTSRYWLITDAGRDALEEARDAA